MKVAFYKEWLYKLRQNKLRILYGNSTGPKYIKNDFWIAPIEEPGIEEGYIEEGGIQWVFSEYFWHGLIYHFHIAGFRDHEHSFEAVMSSAYEFAESFEIRDEDKHEYSEQELEYIQVIVKKTVEDRESES